MKALGTNPASHFFFAREDRDGCSRYRAAKISPDGDELGWYRELILAPMVRGGVSFFGGDDLDRTERVELTTAVMLTDSHGRMLVQNRVKTDWTGIFFPGGHVEPGESFIQAAVREMKEETGLTVSGLKVCGLKQFPLDEGGRYIVLFFKADQFTGELKDSEEGHMLWVCPEELTNYPLSGQFMETLRVFQEDDINEFYCHWQGDEFVRELM